MKNKELFDKTLDILVKAYQNDTLEHGNCATCAVGNMIAANMKISYRKETSGRYCPHISLTWINSTPQWSQVFMTAEGTQEIDSEEYDGKAKEQIDSTGYTWQELAKIEYAFETADEGNSEDDWMFNGLIAVYEVLCEIHKVDKTEIIKPELIFVK